MDFSLHGKPSFIESCNSSWQDACLNIHWFLSLENVQDNLDKWRSEYHLDSSHGSPDTSSLLK
ncbi:MULTISPECIES: integrase core domain-containing protein [unclassified Klebsiella]|uniref:integrase core domain-containing protein n=1 Tax=Enterobacteriaceae TaxID=543 RepID=UPI0016045FE9|nr:transposase [Kluyvera ascorbata]